MVSTNTNLRESENSHNIADNTKHFIEKNVLPTTLVAFGLGVGAGIGIIFLFTDAKRHEGNVAQRLGRKVMDTLSHAVPDALKPGN